MLSRMTYRRSVGSGMTEGAAAPEAYGILGPHSFTNWDKMHRSLLSYWKCASDLVVPWGGPHILGSLSKMTSRGDSNCCGGTQLLACSKLCSWKINVSPSWYLIWQHMPSSLPVSILETVRGIIIMVHYLLICFIRMINRHAHSHCPPWLTVAQETESSPCRMRNYLIQSWIFGCSNVCLHIL